ncbi:hypothetical protein [uncultured Chitinophaga sp.]|uniref:hypothetical protein n=1 Tax=uncultured Chitinophaga sp. TaxID=339340 RepID=UPI0025D4AB16|nr:hypothetical protein [uncultured Chitinophaga sp.]
MKKLYVLTAVLAIGLMACKKDDAKGDKPQVTFKEFSLAEIPANYQGVMLITLDVKDGDGDIENALYIQTKWTTPSTERPYDIRDMPGIGAYKGTSLTAQVQVVLDNNFLQPNSESNLEPDSLYYNIYIEDNAGNISDTVSTPKIRVYRN